jgi:hypothetical protein
MIQKGFNQNPVISLVAVVFLVLAVAVYSRIHRRQNATAVGMAMVSVYLKANYARDFKQAYRYVSSADRRARNETQYIDSQGAYRGFALEAAKMLSDFIEVWPLDISAGKDRMQIKVGYRAPAPADLAPLLWDWDEARLNYLPQDQQQQILAQLKERGKQGKLLMIEGQESFDLRREGIDWRVFLDWESGTRVKLTAEFPDSRDLDVRFAQSEVIAKEDELFLVNLVVKNRSARAVTVAVRHAVSPPSLVDEIEMVQCGLRTPVTLRAGATQDFSMAYLLSADARHTHREIGLAYVFSLK